MEDLSAGTKFIVTDPRMHCFGSIGIVTKDWPEHVPHTFRWVEATMEGQTSLFRRQEITPIPSGATNDQIQALLNICG